MTVTLSEVEACEHHNNSVQVLNPASRAAVAGSGGTERAITAERVFRGERCAASLQERYFT